MYWEFPLRDPIIELGLFCSHLFSYLENSWPTSKKHVFFWFCFVCNIQVTKWKPWVLDNLPFDISPKTVWEDSLISFCSVPKSPNPQESWICLSDLKLHLIRYPLSILCPQTPKHAANSRSLTWLTPRILSSGKLLLNSHLTWVSVQVALPSLLELLGIKLLVFTI